jgi:hypothetical protein
MYPDADSVYPAQSIARFVSAPTGIASECGNENSRQRLTCDLAMVVVSCLRDGDGTPSGANVTERASEGRVAGGRHNGAHADMVRNVEHLTMRAVHRSHWKQGAVPDGTVTCVCRRLHGPGLGKAPQG